MPEGLFGNINIPGRTTPPPWNRCDYQIFSFQAGQRLRVAHGTVPWEHRIWETSVTSGSAEDQLWAKGCPTTMDRFGYKEALQLDYEWVGYLNWKRIQTFISEKQQLRPRDRQDPAQGQREDFTVHMSHGFNSDVSSVLVQCRCGWRGHIPRPELRSTCHLLLTEIL